MHRAADVIIKNVTFHEPARVEIERVRIGTLIVEHSPAERLVDIQRYTSVPYHSPHISKHHSSRRNMVSFVDVVLRTFMWNPKGHDVPPAKRFIDDGRDEWQLGFMIEVG